MPESITRIVREILPEWKMGRNMSKSGIYVIKKMLVSAIYREDTAVGRLYIL